MSEKESRNKNLDAAFETTVRISKFVYLEASSNLYLFFSLTGGMGG
jgi:hypothetical protein